MLGVKNVYYRLEQIDVDNKSTMSNVVNIKLNDNKTSISVQPNPVQSKLEIHVNDNQTSHSIKIQITNINGVKMLSDTKQIGEDNVVTYNTSSWPAGIYIATIIFDDGTKKEIKIAKAK